MNCSLRLIHVIRNLRIYIEPKGIHEGACIGIAVVDVL